MQKEARRSIIVSSYSFAPRRGSEPGDGWGIVQILAKRYQVYVVCAAHYRLLFTSTDLSDLNKQGIEVIFFDHLPTVWLAHVPIFNGATVRMYYSIWQWKVRNVFDSLIQEHRPTFLFHATWGAGTVVSNLRGLGIPVIYGPAGGFDEGAPALELGMSMRIRVTEVLRRFLIRRRLKSRRLRAMYREIELVLACTADSARAFKCLGAPRVSLMGKVGISSERIDTLQQIRSGKIPSPVVRAIFVGRLLGWKGEELALKALAGVENRSIHLSIIGNGPNLGRCIKLARSLGVTPQVSFIGEIPQSELWAHFANSDIFIFPSMHDSGGNVILEAMASSIPIICLNLGGPAEYVDANCGFVCDASIESNTVRDLTAALKTLAENGELRAQMGAAGLSKCRTTFDETARRSLLFGYIDSMSPPRK